MKIHLFHTPIVRTSPTLALLLPTLSFAQGLPTMEDPSRGTGGGIMETIRNYGYDIVLLVALLVVASMFIGVCYHAYGTYAEIHTGKKTWGQFGLTVAIGAVLLDRKSTRLTPVTNAHLVCRLLLEKKKT